MLDNNPDLHEVVAEVNRIGAIPSLLQALCDITGMGFAVVAHVTDTTWMACAVLDTINFGMVPGQLLDVDTTFCREVRATGLPLVIDHASADPDLRSHPTPRMYGFESYISVPIVLHNRRHFGNLCALDPRPIVVSDPRIEFMFTCFARLIGEQLDLQARQQADRDALLDKNIVANLRGMFIALMAHDLRGPLHDMRIAGKEMDERASEPMSQHTGRHIELLVEKMTGVIDNALGYLRDRSRGGIPLRKSQVPDLGARLDAVVVQANEEFGPAKIVSNVSIQVPVYCDAERVTLLAAELLSNALRHGSPSRAVSFVALIDKSTLVLEVWNEGAVIAPSVIKRIFDPFWHHYKNRIHPQVGLYLCAEIARAHSGTLKVTSALDKGTTFSARIPTVAA